MLNTLTTTVPPLPIFIKGGKAVFQKGQVHFQRRFHIFDLLFVTKGTLYMKEEEESFSLSRGQYIILAPHLKHGGSQKCKADTEYYWVHFSLPSYELAVKNEINWSKIIKRQNTFFHSDLYKLHIPRTGIIQKMEHTVDLFLKLFDLNGMNDPAEKMKQQAYFFEIIVELQKEALELPSSAQTISNRCIEYIKENYRDENFNIKHMAKVLLYHPDYITRSMKRSIGITPVQYLNHYRILQAKQALQTGSLDLKTIAKEAGFSEVSYFSRVFKKKEGMTPGQFRRVSHQR